MSDQQDNRLGIPVRILGGQTPWAEIHLEDGNNLRVRLDISAVHNTGRKMQNGYPEYVFNMTPALEVHPSKSKKGKC